MADRVFLLIQEGAVRDVTDSPFRLKYELINASQSWEVYMGHINEFGDREISGKVAHVYPCEGCRTWRVSSSMDGYNRLVGPLTSPTVYVKQRLTTLYKRDRFYDVANLPQLVEVMPG